MYGTGETAAVYSEAYRNVRYVVQSEFDGFKAEPVEYGLYVLAKKAADESLVNNTASYYARARILVDGVEIYTVDRPPGFTFFKGD